VQFELLLDTLPKVSCVLADTTAPTTCTAALLISLRAALCVDMHALVDMHANVGFHVFMLC
jgi:hypothetical protein